MTQHPSGQEAILRAFAAATAQHRAALITYLTLGYPSRAASLELVPSLEAAGADIIELGVPFSDPVADGPVIQQASQCALAQDLTPSDCLSLVAELRAQGVSAPLVLMGYYNPIHSYGPRRYARRCAQAGVDGLIVPDLPPEEAGLLSTACREHGIALIYLVAPTTDASRLSYVAEATQGFLYVVARLGTTGRGVTSGAALEEQLRVAKQAARTPIAVGFGVSDPEQARLLAQQADGVIVGSAIVERAEQGCEAVEAFVSQLREAMVRSPMHVTP